MDDNGGEIGAARVSATPKEPAQVTTTPVRP